MNKKKQSTVLGIDPGYGRCGFGIIKGQGNDWECVTHGCITTESNSYFPDRLSEIYTDLSSLIEQHQIHLIAIEEIFFSKSTTTALKVAQARGVIQLLAAQKNIPVIEVKPNEVKVALTGYGHADKKQMEEMIKTVFHLKEVPKPDDAADALAVAWTGATRMRILQ